MRSVRSSLPFLFAAAGILCSTGEALAQCQGYAIAATASSVSNQCHPMHGKRPYLSWTFQLSCADQCGEIWLTMPSVSATAEGDCSLFPESICVPFFDQYSQTNGLYGVSSARHQYVSGGCRLSEQASWTDGSCPCAPSCGSDDETPQQETRQTEEGSPVIISLSDGQYELTSAEGGVLFDIDGGGSPDQIAWTAEGSDEAFLALDRDRNGSIDSGLELFGDWSPQLPSGERNRFRALALFDEIQNGGNGNGWLDPDDSIYGDLLLWRDYDHDGVSLPGELVPLSASGLEAIDLDYRESRRTDRYGNRFRYAAQTRWTTGESRPVWDVFLRIAPSDLCFLVPALSEPAEMSA